MKPRLTKAGKWSESYGDHGFTVRVAERAPGENALLAWGDPVEYQALGYPVRGRDPRNRWAWDMEALERARNAARDKSAARRLGQARKDALEPTPLTVRQAFALFTAEEGGGMPDSDSARRNYDTAAREFGDRFGDAPWNTVTPAEWEGVIWKAKAAGKHGKAEMLAKNLRGVWKWLRRKRRMKELLDPLEDFEWSKLKEGVKPRQERYSEEETRRLFAVRDEVDPRFALALVMAAEAGPRSKALRLWRRSQLDAPLLPAPPEGLAPHGWTFLPPLKGQEEEPLIFLTAFSRREIDKALSGYLADLEARYQADGVDYPMLPGARIQDARPRVVRVGQSGADRPLGASNLKTWMARAEERAGVRHVSYRLWHGLRRFWTDRVEEAAGLDVAAVAGSWADRTMVERVYRRKSQYGKLEKARQVLEPGSSE